MRCPGGRIGGLAEHGFGGDHRVVLGPYFWWRALFSVGVKGYGIVVWEDGQWRTFSASESLSAILSARVENALKPIAYGYEEDVRDAIMSMAGTVLLADECEHGPRCCEDEGDLSLS